MSSPLPVLLFTHDALYAAAATDAGVDAVVVDWETRGKARRQEGFDTEIGAGTLDDLVRLRAATRARVVCRINNDPASRGQELQQACDAGADEVWLPMVRTVAEVEECLDALPRSAALGILAETPEALELAPAWSRLPLARVYVGLNDLAIASGARGLFDPLCDGRLERFRAEYGGPLGFAGVTHPDHGSPVPCRLLLAEMARLECAFGVARRSFRRDVAAAELPAALQALRARWSELLARPPAQVASDRAELLLSVREAELCR